MRVQRPSAAHQPTSIKKQCWRGTHLNCFTTLLVCCSCAHTLQTVQHCLLNRFLQSSEIRQKDLFWYRNVWNVSLSLLNKLQYIWHPHPVTLLLAELSVICELAIHLVSPTTVRACGSRPTSLTVIIKWCEDFSTRTASSCGMPRKLRPFTSRIWSPTCGDDGGERGEGGRSGAGRAGRRVQGGGDGYGVVWISGQISVQW